MSHFISLNQSSVATHSWFGSHISDMRLHGLGCFLHGVTSGVCCEFWSTHFMGGKLQGLYACVWVHVPLCRGPALFLFHSDGQGQV